MITEVGRSEQHEQRRSVGMFDSDFVLVSGDDAPLAPAAAPAVGGRPLRVVQPVPRSAQTEHARNGYSGCVDCHFHFFRIGAVLLAGFRTQLPTSSRSTKKKFIFLQYFNNRIIFL